jgi:ribose transport system substrate-binding protein
MNHRCAWQSRALSIALSYIALFGLLGCRWKSPVRIAVIPRTSGTMLWDPEHGGARAAAAANSGTEIYWNAPTREDDVAAQIALVEQVSRRGYRGLVLAPVQSLALITPVRRAMAGGLYTVIVSSPLPVSPGGDLSYILNDDEAGGRIAAQRAALILHGHGSVAVLGINPDIDGIMVRARSFEQFMTRNYPDIHVVDKRMGSFNVPHEQQIVEETLKANPEVDLIVALMWATTRGAMSTIDSAPSNHQVKVIGFDPDAMAFTSPSLDSVIVQNTREMGNMAVGQIEAQIKRQPVPAIVNLPPVLVTRENLNSEEVRKLTSMDWGARAPQLKWNAVD